MMAGEVKKDTRQGGENELAGSRSAMETRRKLRQEKRQEARKEKGRKDKR